VSWNWTVSVLIITGISIDPTSGRSRRLDDQRGARLRRGRRAVTATPGLEAAYQADGKLLVGTGVTTKIRYGAWIKA
jgi:hypothetical protein